MVVPPKIFACGGQKIVFFMFLKQKRHLRRRRKFLKGFMLQNTSQNTIFSCFECISKGFSIILQLKIPKKFRLRRAEIYIYGSPFYKIIENFQNIYIWQSIYMVVPHCIRKSIYPLYMCGPAAFCEGRKARLLFAKYLCSRAVVAQFSRAQERAFTSRKTLESRARAFLSLRRCRIFLSRSKFVWWVSSTLVVTVGIARRRRENFGGFVLQNTVKNIDFKRFQSAFEAYF